MTDRRISAVVVFIFVFCNLCIAEDPPILVKLSSNLKLQILLDRSGYSPGEIDGRFGVNTRKALSAFQKFNNLKPTGKPDSLTLKLLDRSPEQPLLKYHAILERDVAGPFIPKFPKDLQAQTKLARMEYTSVIELLSESFHVNPVVLRKWNPRAKFKVNEKIIVPSITSLDDMFHSYTDVGDVTVFVSKKNSDLFVRNDEGEVIMYAPVTQGDNLAPLPLGKWEVVKIEDYPYFHYNPKLFSRPNKKHKGGLIPPGPNNPVGIVWIDLSLDHYGLHGTSAPEKVGHTASNGCIRLTNWDVFRLSTMVEPGTEVHFIK
ncbi:L,D-transpeptidase [bacterium]|nr:L,D-transpeptidase [bacterium]MCI0605967.1 L,D-transpeptidase [bacterium]